MVSLIELQVQKKKCNPQTNVLGTKLYFAVPVNFCFKTAFPVAAGPCWKPMHDRASARPAEESTFKTAC